MSRNQYPRQQRYNYEGGWRSGRGREYGSNMDRNYYKGRNYDNFSPREGRRTASPIRARSPMRDIYQNSPPSSRRSFPDSSRPSTSKILNSRICEANNRQYILKIIGDELPNFSTINLATSIHRLARRKGKDDISAEEVLASTEFANVIKEISNRILQFRPQELANTAWGLAIMGYKDEALFRSISNHVKTLAPSFIPQEVANTIWSFAKVELNDTELFQILDYEAIRKFDGFITAGLASIMWAYAQTGFRSTRFVSALCNINDKMISSLRSKEIADIFWALTLMDVEVESSFIGKLITQSLSILSSFSPSELSRVLWAISKTVDKIAVFSPLELSHILFAYAQMSLYAHPIFDAVMTFDIKQLETFKLEDLAIIAWAFAKLLIKNEDFFSRLESIILKSLNSCSPSHLGSILWSFAVLNIPSSLISASLEYIMKEQPQPWECSAFANCAWAFTVYSLFDKEFFGTVYDIIRSRSLTLDDQSKGLFHQVVLSIKYESDLNLDIPNDLFKEFSDSYSKLHSPTFDLLKDFRSTVNSYITQIIDPSSVSMEKALDDGIIIDIVIEREKPLAIEIGGIGDYASHSPLGSIVLKRRLLEKLGYVNVAIPHYEWELLKSDSEKIGRLSLWTLTMA